MHRTLSLFELNWLPALYALPAWWGEWTPHARAPLDGSPRLVQRLSLALLQAQGLHDRLCDEASAPPWVRWPDATLRGAAHRLGRVALAHRVRQSLHRAHVLRTIDLLGPSGRDDALADAANWPALAGLLPEREGLPRSPAEVTLLGAGVMAELLDDQRSGSRQRFALRFAPDSMMPVALSARQAGEARAWLNAWARTCRPQEAEV